MSSRADREENECTFATIARAMSAFVCRPPGTTPISLAIAARERMVSLRSVLYPEVPSSAV